MRLAQALILSLCLGLAALVGRLVYINTKLAPDLRAYSYPRQTSTIVLHGSRGAILDRRYRVLAGSADQFMVYADPRLVPDHGEAADRLAPIVGLKAQDIRQKLDNPTSKGFVILCHMKENKKDEIAKLELRGIGVQREPARVYPMGKLAAHVLGHVGSDSKGLEGVELLCNSKLEGTPGKRTVFCDVHRRAMFQEQDSYVAPKDGVHVVLTIDANIQEKLEQQLAERVQFHNADSSLGVVMNPKTGEILAMANYPTFDPMDAGDAPPAVRRNRVLTDPVEPGSVFKSYVMSAVIANRAARREEMIDCHNGLLPIGNRKLHDAHPYGALSVDHVLAKSSNIGMAILGMRMGNHKIYSMLHALGFAEKTGIELLGEDRGLVYPVNRWTKLSTCMVPMGQEVAVTPIQLITAFSAICNGGKLLQPRIVAAVVGEEGEIIEDHTSPVERRQAMDPDVSKTMVEMLTKVCTEGTGKECKLEFWQPLGKTGTAQIPFIGKGRHGYEPGSYLASFIGAAPASDPQVVVLIMTRHPRKNGYYGGVVSLPGVKEVLKYTLNYLNVPHDLVPAQQQNQVAMDSRD